MQAINEELFTVRDDADGSSFIEIEWTPPQSKFLQTDAPFPLFVGGFGSGKTTTMVGSMFRDLVENPGANVAGYAPTYDLLNLVTIPALLDFLDASGLEYDHNKTRYTIDVAGYGMFILRSLDNPKRIVGYKTFRAHIDELDTLSKAKAEEAWNKVIARNRQKIVDEEGNLVSNGVSAYTTPEGYVFCYERWVKKKEKGYVLFKAPTRSNPHNPPDYEDNLRRTYDDALVEAYLNGEFVNLHSTSVYKCFDRERNATDIHEPFPGERLYVGMDFNIDVGAAAIHVIRDGLVYAIDEIANSHDTENTIDILNDRYPDNPISVYPDVAGTHRSSSNSSPSRTDIAMLERAGFSIEIDYSGANPRVKDRVNSVNAMLRNGKGVTRYFINIDKCPNMVESLERQVWDDNGAPDKKSGLDHMADALGYFIAAMFPIVRVTAGYG